MVVGGGGVFTEGDEESKDGGVGELDFKTNEGIASWKRTLYGLDLGCFRL